MKTLDETQEVLKQFEHTPMGAQLKALFKSEPQERVPDDDEYAIAVQLVLANSNHGIAGMLSVEPSGLLRVVQPGLAQDPQVQSRPPIPVLAYHYLTIHQIGALIVVKPRKAQPQQRPLIVT